MAGNTNVEIDDSLYSRQRYMLGDSAMKKMAQSSVLLCGAGGLGIEIAKNIVLAGIKVLSVLDEKPCCPEDLGNQFFIREDDIIKQFTRAEASVPRLAELNPYVTVRRVTGHPQDLLTTTSVEYDCVVVTEMPLNDMITINKLCRARTPAVKFISGDVYGLLGSAFCDFGSEFEVFDKLGEEPKQFFIGNITQSNPGVVTTYDKQLHGLENGNSVMFTEVVGMTEINGETHKAKVLSPHTFSIGDTSAGYSEYKHNGHCIQRLMPHTIYFNTLEDQLNDPQLLLTDLCKPEEALSQHVAYLVCKRMSSLNQKNVSSAEFLHHAKDIHSCQKNKTDLVEDLLRNIGRSFSGCLPPLCAALGGFIAQECLKALTAKFTPLQQWLHLDCTALAVDSTDEHQEQTNTRGNRHFLLKNCIGSTLLKKLTELRLFMVGCGAIGCEMLKNFALLGVGSGPSGQIVITDNDMIEKSNLNRQFLFRPHHIKHPKSVMAAKSVREINPDLNIISHQHRVCPETERTIYTDTFFSHQDLCVNALDNVEARKYMDSRCVANEISLIETGTMGSKGHVQVIVSHLTETYCSQNDPVDMDVPYCTLKSFPATIEHCIQWARDKFESSFVQKPVLFNSFWSKHTDYLQLVQNLQRDVKVDNSVQVSLIIPNKPRDWSNCIRLARIKFEKYFCNRAKQLLHAFPVDSKLSDNITLFWQSPKRAPTPLQFDIHNELHMSFILSAARLFAERDRILHGDITVDYLTSVIDGMTVPTFVPSNKTIETSADAKKPERLDNEESKASQAVKIIESFLTKQNNHVKPMVVLEFEKDNDSNGHVQFMSAAANLRASMYQIETCDTLRVKKIAGRIVPAIATTTSLVAGLATIELMKVVKQCKLEDLRNSFLNLALPVLVLSEPAPARQHIVKDGVTFTVWDKWSIHGNSTFTLRHFISYFQEQYGLCISMVVEGVKPIYIPALPLHTKRLNQTMVNLLQPKATQKYSNLIVSFENENETDDDVMDDTPAPPIRYYFGL